MVGTSHEMLDEPFELAEPDAAALIESMRAIGYEARGLGEHRERHPRAVGGDGSHGRRWTARRQPGPEAVSGTRPLDRGPSCDGVSSIPGPTRAPRHLGQRCEGPTLGPIPD